MSTMTFERRRTAQSELLSRDDFRARLEETLHDNLTLSHPIFTLLLDESNPRPVLLRHVALQGYQLTKHFLSYIEHIYFYCPIPKHKRLLLNNLYEEETGKFSKTKNHVRLMEDFLAAIGVTREDIDVVEPLPATRELIDYRLDAVKDVDKYHIGAAAVTIASEGQNLETLGQEPRHNMFERVYGLTEKDLLFFSVHQKEDIGHTQQGLDLVADFCTTQDLQEEAVYAVDHTCKLFYAMYEGIYQEFVVKQGIDC